jgi:hypothetical protein
MRPGLRFALSVAVLSALFGLALYADIARTHDDTDAPGQRSGLSLYTDSLTGCQYVGTFFSLTQRLNSAGLPICVKP